MAGTKIEDSGTFLDDDDSNDHTIDTQDTGHDNGHN